MVTITHTFEDARWQQLLDSHAQSAEFQLEVRKNPALTPKDFVIARMFQAVSDIAKQVDRARVTKAAIDAAVYPEPVTPVTVTVK